MYSDGHSSDRLRNVQTIVRRSSKYKCSVRVGKVSLANYLAAGGNNSTSNIISRDSIYSHITLENTDSRYIANHDSSVGGRYDSFLLSLIAT